MLIAVHSPSQFQRLRPLWEALEILFPVSFAPAEPGNLTVAAAHLWLEPVAVSAIAALPRTASHLVYAGPHDSAPTQETPSASEVELSPQAPLHPLIRGLKVPHGDFATVPAPWPLDQASPVARKGGQPFWWTTNSGGVRVEVVTCGLPDFAAGSMVYEHLSERSFARLLPLVTLLQQLCGEGAWQPPHLRAAFMFDDPNLHASTYGHIGFQSIAQHAAEHRHHVSFATVPLDGWWASRAAAALFRKHADRLSLLVHGNDHTREELARTGNLDAALALIDQALKRTARNEAASGVPVSRVMAAPHGACNEFTHQAMLHLGMEAACISRGSLRHWNRRKSWPPAMGLRPCEFMAGGFPVIPRYGMRTDTPWTYLCAAMLGQPVVVVGHHQDVAEGYDILAQIASLLNKRGHFVWENLSAISRSNYLVRRQRDVLLVRLFSRRVQLPIPPGISRLRVECPWEPAARPDRVHALFSREGGTATEVRQSGPVAEFESPAGSVCTLTVPPPALNASVAHPRPSVAVWPVVRRLLAECRDRVAPLKRGRLTA